MDPHDGDSSRVTTDNVSPVGTNRRIASNWTKRRLLGRKSCGSVYEGCTDVGFFFTVKELSFLDHEVQGSRLEEAISLLSTFEHENIVQYIGTSKNDSTLHIFLELGYQMCQYLD
ncbi:mitogen-activated protein kinase kinase kinase 1-like isoform X2 [Daucus carota subsp. sativus]|uniref:mitogen-activated protein kinase kinase kinase 1-like isoform X2 n=1 Tax=Daucus carota subsp. sativus TaxID=79200 RepID=UPI0030835005